MAKQESVVALADPKLWLSVTGKSTSVTVSGTIALSEQDVGPYQVQILRPGHVITADTRKKVENSRAVRRGKVSPRNLLQIQPVCIDVTAGPAFLMFKSGDAEPVVLSVVDLPDHSLMRFRRILDIELANGLLERRTKRRLARLWTAFSALGEKRPDNAEWLECFILINMCGRSRQIWTRDCLGRLRDVRAASGKLDLFEAFALLLVEQHKLELPNGHGYGGSFETRDKAAVWKSLAGIIARLEGLGLKVFLNSGTLLGAVREGNLLGHDDDIDLAVLIEGRSPDGAAQSWLKLRAMLAANGLDKDYTEGSVGRSVRLPYIDGVRVDLTPAWIDQSDKLFIFPHTCGTLKRADLLPLKPGPFVGTSIPARADRVLEQNYGPAWRVPDTLFRFPWNTALASFLPFTTALSKACHLTGQREMNAESVEVAEK